MNNETHTITLQNRKDLTITGVNKLITINETRSTINTIQGTIIIEGSKLEIKSLDLDKGIITITGIIYKLAYEQKTNQKQSLFKRIIK